jgi:vacuolar-type H+-ATPase subunit H
VQYDLDPAGQQSGTAELSPSGSPQPGASASDPAEAQRSMRDLTARIRQLEEQARQVSASFLMESALREAGELRLQSVKAAERTYTDAVKAAEQEAKRILDEAEQKAAELIEQAHAEGERRAEELLDQARQEAGRIRQGAYQAQTETRRELERVSTEFNAFVQRLIERTTVDSPAPDSSPEPTAQSIAPPIAEPAIGSAALASESFGPSEGIGTDDGSGVKVQPEPTPAAPTIAEAPNPEPAVASAPNTDWGADWADQLRQVPSIEPEPAAASDEPPPPGDKPEDPGQKDGFKLPSWLPS